MPVTDFNWMTLPDPVPIAPRAMRVGDIVRLAYDGPGLEWVVSRVETMAAHRRDEHNAGVFGRPFGPRHNPNREGGATECRLCLSSALTDAEDSEAWRLVYRPQREERVVCHRPASMRERWSCLPSIEVAQELAAAIDGASDQDSAINQFAVFSGCLSVRSYFHGHTTLSAVCMLLAERYNASGATRCCVECARDLQRFEYHNFCANHFVCGGCGERVLLSTQCGLCRDVLRLNRCPNCCLHGECRGTADGHDPHICELGEIHGCGVCQNHCECPRCQTNCAEGGGEDLCGMLESCSNCHSCRDHCYCQPTSRHCLPNFKMPMRIRESKRYYRGLRRLLGTELEIRDLLRPSNTPALISTLKEWNCSVVGDGSIGGRGMEIVTSPAGGEQWVAQVNAICESLQKTGAFVSQTCGQHVHVDARDFGVYDLARVIRLYAHVESALFEALPVGRRRDNHYCKPCGSTYLEWLSEGGKRLTKKWLAAKQYGVILGKPGRSDEHKARSARDADIIKDYASHKYHDSRYKALNLHSFWHRGTIEFRHARGSALPETVRNWGIVCGSVVEFAAKHGDADVLKLSALDSREALLATIQEVEVREWLKTRWEKFTGPHGQILIPLADPVSGEL